MKIGFTSTTLKQLSPEEIIELAAKAGADCIEWSDKHAINPEQARDIARQCAKFGIACCSVGSYYCVGENDANRWDSICQTTDALGAQFIRVWLGNKGSTQTDEEEYAKLIADAQNMVKAAAKYGVTIAAEAHPNTYNDSCETSLRFLHDLNEPAFSTYYQSLYQDMPADFKRLEQTYMYVRAAHVSFSEVKRNQRFRRKERDCVERIVKVLHEKGFQHPVLLEFCKRDSPHAFLRDMKRLKQII